jgi:shikimate kinase
MDVSWILLGMPGSGKSSIGRALALRAGRAFLDTDALIERRLGRRVSDVFRVYGEAAFRDHETAALKSLSPGLQIVSCGGGIVLREENWVEMRRLGVTAFLDVAENVLADRLSEGRRKRPLLADADWRDRLGDLYRDRRCAYLRADLHLELTGLSIDECVESALEKLTAADGGLHRGCQVE